MQARSWVSSALEKKRWLLAVGGAIGVGLVLLLVSGTAPGAHTPERSGSPSNPTPAGAGAETSGEQVGTPSRVLEVLVEGCRGPAADALVFVKVDEELVSGTTDPLGKVRIKAKPGAAQVRARVAGWEGIASAEAGQSSVMVRSCRGAEVRGRVIYSGSATPAVGVTVRLVDGAGAALDEIETDENGAYRLVDTELAAHSVEVAASADGEGTEEELAALRSGEVRELDIAIGTTFELVGWVVDLAGDPLPGVFVSIAAEGAGASWRGVTDQGGGFRFERAPVQPLRLTADGGDLGLVSRRVVPFDERRMDVTLVLEPTGTIVVLTPPGVRGQVVVQSWSTPLIHGAMPEPSAEEYYPQPDFADDGVPTEALPDPEPEPELERMNGILTKAFADYDEAEPVESLVRFLGHLREAMPELEQTLRGELGELAPSGDGKSFEELARLAATRLIETDPSAMKAFGIAARKVREGLTGVDALMAASQEMSAEQLAENEAASPEMAEEAVPAEVEVPTEDLPLGESDYAAPPESPLLTRLQEQFGGLVFNYYPDDAGLAARGAVGEELRVPGAFRYSIILILEETEPDGTRYAISCGEVLVPAGRTIELYCGAETEGTLTGRVVDVKGRPIEGARVSLNGAEEVQTDQSGTYTFSYKSRLATPCSLLVTKEGAIDEDWRPSERINLQCAPGSAVEVAPITLRRESEAPLLQLDEPFGGVGAALEQGYEGVMFSAIRPDGPLALDGLDAQSTILKVDDEDASSWPVEEMLARLRGDVGTYVQLQVRGPDGELIETTIERALVTP